LGDGNNDASISPLCPFILKVVSKITGIAAQPSTELLSMRVDSLGTTLLAHKLSIALGGLAVPVTDFYRFETVNDLATDLFSRCAQSKPEVLRHLGLDPSATTTAIASKKAVAHSAAATSSSSSGSGGIDRLLIGLRCLLIVWVVTEHGLSLPKYKGLVDRSYINTCLFVMLSGFTLYLSFLSANGRISWRSYFKSKILGLFPIYYFALALYLPWYISLRLKPGAYYYNEYHEDKSKYVVDAIMYLTCLQVSTPLSVLNILIIYMTASSCPSPCILTRTYPIAPVSVFISSVDRCGPRI